MRWWIALPMLVACSHGPTPLPESSDQDNSAPARARVSDCAKALSAKDAIPRPLDKPVSVVAFLCEDRSRVECPPCPEGANCAQCIQPVWVFCDAPGVQDPANSLSVFDPPPGMRVMVGQRYLLKGKKSDTRTLSLDSIYYAD